MKKLFCVLLLVPALAFGEEGEVRLDTAPIRTDAASLQAGARTFVNYCLNCHSAASVRYNQLVDIGLTEAQIKESLLFAREKTGESMKVAMAAKDAKEWFGTSTPDLSVIARSRSADWLYTYFRTFYRDSTRPTGWNNTTFANVAMPHVLYELQGEQALKVEKAEGGEHDEHAAEKTSFEKLTTGRLTKLEYDNAVADLVSFLVYIAEPKAHERTQMGKLVLFGLFVLTLLAYFVKRDYWRDVH
jgi:ubiquinol-cytochrome c reductase cytochrome c1 subunit